MLGYAQASWMFSSFEHVVADGTGWGPLVAGDYGGIWITNCSSGGTVVCRRRRAYGSSARCTDGCVHVGLHCQYALHCGYLDLMHIQWSC
jgi:hypothetical protein